MGGVCHVGQTLEGVGYMATVFGISGIKSRLDEWRGSRKNTLTLNSASEDIDAKALEVVSRSDEDYDLSFLLENLVIPKLIADRDKRDEWLDPAALFKQHDILLRRAITPTDVEEFTQLSLSSDAHILLDFVDHLLAAGSSVETLYVELLAPAARRLGEFWEEDSADFVDVTMGLWRIQEILRELTLRIPPQPRPGHGQRSALFSPMPGEQHSFGTLMITECFQRAGWETDALIEPTQSELIGKCAKMHYDLIGLTVSCDYSTASLVNLVKTIRVVSCNPKARIVVGGRVINEQPDLVAQCGADATAVDATSAVVLADRLVPIKARCFQNLM